MGVLGFLLGLGLGLALLLWHRSRLDARIKNLLRDLKPDAPGSSLSSDSQLRLAIAYQQKIQQGLERQIDSYRQVLNEAPLGYLQVDDENRLIWCNQQACDLLGILEEQHSRLPRLLLEVVRSYELDELIERSRALHQPCEQDWVFYPVSPDPSQLVLKQPCTIRGRALPLLQDHVAIFLENRQEAITLIQQRDRWASDVAHELKTPLTSIRLVAETLYVRLDPPLQGWVNRLISEVDRLSNLVQDLLDLSHIDRGSAQTLALKTTDLPPLIQAAWLSLEPLARKKHLELDYYGPDHCLIQLDESRFYRVLINLLDNSIKFSPPWQHIRVQVRVEEGDHDGQPGSWANLEVIDAGPGFPENALPYVFDRFYRADPSRSQHLTREMPQTPSGLGSNTTATAHVQEPVAQPLDSQHRSSSGLGLAIVKQIVEAHQGSVSAQNHPETGGAWLKVSLPRNSH